VAGGFVDTSVPDGIGRLLVNLSPEARAAALTEIGEALGLFRDLDGDRREQPSNADAAADLEDLGRSAADLRERLDRVPTNAEALADLVLHKARRPLWSEFSRRLAESLRQLDSLSITIARRLRDLPKAGAPPATHRRLLFDKLAQIAQDHNIAFHSPPDFAARAFKILAIKPPGRDRRTREK